MKKLAGFGIFVSIATIILNVGIIQGILYAPIFETVLASIIQVVVLTASTFFISKRLMGKVAFYGAPGVDGTQKKYTASKAVLVVTAIAFIVNIIAVAS